MIFKNQIWDLKPQKAGVQRKRSRNWTGPKWGYHSNIIMIKILWVGSAALLRGIQWVAKLLGSRTTNKQHHCDQEIARGDCSSGVKWSYDQGGSATCSEQMVPVAALLFTLKMLCRLRVKFLVHCSDLSYVVVSPRENSIAGHTLIGASCQTLKLPSKGPKT